MMVILVIGWTWTAVCQANEAPAWSGAGQHRIILSIDPVALTGGRTIDAMVARYDIDFGTLLFELGVTDKVDLSTLQIHKFDPNTGQPELYPTFDSSRSPYDRPCRFEDDSVPESYPSRPSYVSYYPSGQGPIVSRKRGGRLFNRIMRSDTGKLIWTHTQQNNATSYYALYWDVLSPGALLTTPPAPLIGDADVIRYQNGTDLIGTAQTRMTTGDIDGDGLFDIVSGDQKGNILWWRNDGVLGAPRFLGCQPLNDEAGPITVGWYTNPQLYDWNDDGLLDLLVGTSNDVIVWWLNTGSPTNPQLVFQGYIQSDGARLVNPMAPCAEDPLGSQYLSDYCCFPYVCDWNDDGLPDLLVGSYITGQIIFYRCTGRSGGIPQLTSEGPLESGGVPIDTVWCSMPAAYDFDGDGLLELMSGSWKYQAATPVEDFIFYYKNLGTAQAPDLVRHTFPKTGSFPGNIQASISVVDWNNDSLQDLLVLDGVGNLYVYLNNGTVNAPSWLINNVGLTGDWGFAGWPLGAVSSIVDLDHDGSMDLLSSNAAVYEITGSYHSPLKVHTGSATVNGSPIWHAGPGYGDPYNYNTLADWDHDGWHDILCGTQQGNIYFHRNLGEPGGKTFAPGVKLKLTTGEDVKVGPPVYANPEDVPDFTALQGSRSKALMNDVDNDGIDDLIVLDTYSNINVFLNTVQNATDKLQAGVVAQVSTTREFHDLFDWNYDGLTDLIAGPPTTNPGTIFVNQSTIGNPTYAVGTQPMNLPYLFWGAIFHSTDWNSDGDRDFLVHAEYYGFWIEGSFIEHGYAVANRRQLPRVEFTETNGSTETSEDQALIDTYQVVLFEPPAETVTVILQPDQQLMVDKPQLIFTTQDWNVPQTITVRAVNDEIYESYPPATHQGAIDHIFQGGGYDFQGNDRLYVAILDNDRQCGDPGTVYRVQDFNEDCYVDLKDFSQLATLWLKCYDPARQVECEPWF